MGRILALIPGDLPWPGARISDLPSTMSILGLTAVGSRLLSGRDCEAARVAMRTVVLPLGINCPCATLVCSCEQHGGAMGCISFAASVITVSLIVPATRNGKFDLLADFGLEGWRLQKDKDLVRPRPVAAASATVDRGTQRVGLLNSGQCAAV